ncbi:MAG: phosphotransferase [Betaproteobacteria bacterium]|nr:phosphotransferase [Betaproteobacteria bacterium]
MEQEIGLDPTTPRLEALDAWLRAQFADDGTGGFDLAPASTDASFRRYFRITTPRGTLIAMDAPREQEDCRPFVQVAALMREAGVNAPRVLAADFDQGFLLLTDLGRQTYLDVLDDERFDELFRPANGALVRWQLASRDGALPVWDAGRIRAEMQLFVEWYLGRHAGVTLGAAQAAALSGVFEAIAARCLAQRQVFVHSDYMPRNLMVSDDLPGVLDFQDAVIGPIAYDVASLYRDAFISWDEERVLDGTVRYWDAARQAGLPVPAQFGDFYEDVEWTGLQRHLRILGVFARLQHRDGKPHYLADAPRFIHYVRHTCRRYRALGPLIRLLDEFAIGDTAVEGLSF